MVSVRQIAHCAVLNVAVTRLPDKVAGEEKPRQELGSLEWVVLAVCAVAVILLGIIPNNEAGDFLSWLRALDWSRESIALLVTR